MDQRILDLKHITRSLPGGGMVLVLNTGAVITAEAEAMLQALHSRSPKSVLEHLKVLAERGPEKFMENFYVGYGHKSIGDCGTGTIFIEGVSMLVAKAIQDWLLYSGQEASTRYIDFAEQTFVDPINTLLSSSVHAAWREFYLRSQEPVREHLRNLFPRNEGENETVYEKAIKARSFDILRGFLPAGAATNLAWHTNLRQAADHLALLRHHPLSEVQVVADAMEAALNEMYPSSFGHKRYPSTEAYNRTWMSDAYYYDGSESQKLVSISRGLVLARDTIDPDLLAEYAVFLGERPEKTELPKRIGECGTIQFRFPIDFGSFRDVQRHRAVIQCMPLLTSRFGIHQWYFQSLPTNIEQEARRLVREQLAKIEVLDDSKVVRQYYLPMGMLVPCRLTGDLPALVYLIERRAQTDVHPTLQHIALGMANMLESRYRSLGLRLYVDREMGRFTIKRGLQDITERK